VRIGGREHPVRFDGFEGGSRLCRRRRGPRADRPLAARPALFKGTIDGRSRIVQVARAAGSGGSPRAARSHIVDVLPRTSPSSAGT
jgi:hypothetical protein